MPAESARPDAPASAGGATAQRRPLLVRVSALAALLCPLAMVVVAVVALAGDVAIAVLAVALIAGARRRCGWR